jgi:hypothetical protein
MSLWALGFIAGLLVVLVVAALLVGILIQARRILGLAKVAADVVAQIDVNTRSVWALAATNKVAGDILAGATAIDANAAAIVAAVSHSDQSKAA